MGLKSNERAVGYPQDVSATIAPLGMSRRAGHCVSQASQLGRTVDCSSPLAACTAPSGTMKAAPRGGDVQVRSSSIHPSPVSSAVMLTFDVSVLSLFPTKAPDNGTEDSVSF